MNETLSYTAETEKSITHRLHETIQVNNEDLQENNLIGKLQFSSVIVLGTTQIKRHKHRTHVQPDSQWRMPSQRPITAANQLPYSKITGKSNNANKNRATAQHHSSE
jgi:hypothetical protein